MDSRRSPQPARPTRGSRRSPGCSPAPPRTRPATWPASASRELRIGLREGLLEEAIAAAFDAELDSVRRAHMLIGEIGETAVLARDGRLDEAALHLGRPIRPMLATPVGDADEVMRRVGDEAWIEDKYDGIRASSTSTGGTSSCSAAT